MATFGSEREIQQRLLDKIKHYAPPLNIDVDMRRRVGQQNGYVYRKGPSWLGAFREYAKGTDGTTTGVSRSVRIGPAVGPERLSKREAERLFKEETMDPLNRRNLRPSSSMLVSDFITEKFTPQVAERKKPAGRKHYEYLLSRFVVPALGSRRICDIQMDDVETLVSQLLAKGYAHQTVLHVKNCISAVWRHARRLKLYRDENPAAGVDLGERPVIRRLPTYDWGQAALVLSRLPSPVREMAQLSIATSMNVAEMCGLRRKWCNFTDAIVVVDGEVLAPYSIAVRENFYCGQYGSLKSGSRRRNVPITRELAEVLQCLTTTGPESPLFPSRNGTPLDSHNINTRIFRPLGVKLGFPVTWHALRRCHSSLVGQLEGVALEDRVATMGHADARMTLHYSVADMERRRAIPEQILARLKAESVPVELKEMEAKGGVQ